LLRLLLSLLRLLLLLLPELPLLGLSVLGLSVLGLSVLGLSVLGLSVLGLSVLGLSVLGLSLGGSTGLSCSCAFETVAADAPNTITTANVKTPKLFFVKLDFILSPPLCAARTDNFLRSPLEE